MNFFRHALISCLSAAAVAAVLAGCASTGDDATATLARSTQAMGSTTLKTLRYAGNGIGFTFGQAYTPGGAWPKITVHSMTRTLDYEAMTTAEWLANCSACCVPEIAGALTRAGIRYRTLTGTLLALRTLRREVVGAD